MNAEFDNFLLGRAKCRALVADALAAHKRRNYRERNHLCWLHDDIAITLPVVAPPQPLAARQGGPYYGVVEKRRFRG